MIDNWLDQAYCKGADRDQFFPFSEATSGDLGKNVKTRCEQTIEKFCKHCPVRLECFDYACELSTSVMVVSDRLQSWHIDGIWGGFIFRRSDGNNRALITKARKRIEKEIA